MVTLWFYLFFHHGARVFVFHSYLHNSLLWNGLSLPPPATAFLIPCLSLLLCLLLCQPFQSDASDCRIWSAVYIIKTHSTQTPKLPLSPARAFALRCPNRGELCKVRGSCLQEKNHHKEGNTDRRVPALVKKRSFWNWSLNVKNRLSGHRQ